MTIMKNEVTQQIWVRVNIKEFQDALRAIPPQSTNSDLRAQVATMTVVMRRVVAALNLAWNPEVTFADQVVDAIVAWKTKAGEGDLPPSKTLEDYLADPALANDLAFWQMTAINLAGAYDDHCRSQDSDDEH